MSKSVTPTEDLWADYQLTHSVWETGKNFGLAGQSVHERLTRSGYKLKGANFSPEEDEIIRQFYSLSEGVQDINLPKLTEMLGRPHHTNVSRRARELGLTDRKRGRTTAQKEFMSKRTKEMIATKGHPRGMAGKKHTVATKKVLAEKSKQMWKDPNNKLNSPEYRQALSDRMSNLMTSRIASGTWKPYSNAHKGWAEFSGGKRYFLKSGWELKYAEYLEILLGGKAIKAWEYEPTTFWFEKIKRGVRSYTPDFKITHLDDSVEYHEVKGYMDSKSATKIKRMKIYYPDVSLTVISQPDMKALGLI